MTVAEPFGHSICGYEYHCKQIISYKLEIIDLYFNNSVHRNIK